QPLDLHGCTVARSGGHSRRPRHVGVAHLIHPGAAVPLVAAVDEAGAPVDENVNVKSEVAHGVVKVRPGVVLAEGYPLRVALEDFLDDFRHGRSARVRARVVRLAELVRPHEPPRNDRLQELLALR
ncbi:MAG: hypothetical protein BJ554DRAFT_3573, partial [Olpidium bornovanus]